MYTLNWDGFESESSTIQFIDPNYLIFMPGGQIEFIFCYLVWILNFGMAIYTMLNNRKLLKSNGLGSKPWIDRLQ